MITLGLGTQANFSGGGGINPSGSTWLKELLSDVTLGSIIQGNYPGGEGLASKLHKNLEPWPQLDLDTLLKTPIM